MSSQEVDVTALGSRDAVVDQARTLLTEANEEIVLAWPGDRLSLLESELRAAHDRGVLVVLVATGSGSSDALKTDFADLATVARSWNGLDHEACGTFSLLCVDGHRGLIIPTRLLFDMEGRTRTIAFDDEYLEHMAFGWFLSGFWVNAVEEYAAGPPEFPHTFTDFRHAVIATAVALRERQPLTATIEARRTDDDQAAFERDTGRVVNVRQRFVSPSTNTFPGEQTLVLRLDGEKITVGGHGAFLEDYEAKSVTLRVEEYS
jgi:hypothetical protein